MLNRPCSRCHRGQLLLLSTVLQVPIYVVNNYSSVYLTCVSSAVSCWRKASPQPLAACRLSGAATAAAAAETSGSSNAHCVMTWYACCCVSIVSCQWIITNLWRVYRDQYVHEDRELWCLLECNTVCGAQRHWKHLHSDEHWKLS